MRAYLCWYQTRVYLLLRAIFYEGTKRKTTKIVSAFCVGDKDFNEPKLTKMEYDFILRSPEALFREENWCDRLQNPEYQRKIKLIVVDKAHKMVHWYVTVYLKNVYQLNLYKLHILTTVKKGRVHLLVPVNKRRLYDHQNHCTTIKTPRWILGVHFKKKQQQRKQSCSWKRRSFLRYPMKLKEKSKTLL